VHYISYSVTFTEPVYRVAEATKWLETESPRKWFFLNKEISEEKNKILKIWMDKQVGKKFNQDAYIWNFLFGWEYDLKGKVWFCSELMGSALLQIGFNLTIPPCQLTPPLLYNFCLQELDFKASFVHPRIDKLKAEFTN